MGQLVQACRANEVTDLILVHEHRGEPGLECTMIMLIIIMIMINYKLVDQQFHPALNLVIIVLPIHKDLVNQTS